MLSKMKEMNVGQARYVVIKELDTRGPIGQLLLNLDPQLTSTMMNLCEAIFETDNWLGECDKICEANNNGAGQAYPDPPTFLGFDNRYVQIIMTIADVLPAYTLMYSELDWDTFCSAFATIIDNYISVVMAGIDRANFPSEHREEHERNAQMLSQCLNPIYKLVEIGAGYEELLRASAKLVQQMKSWEQSAPSPVRLSQTYLESLGFYTKKEEGK